MTNIDPVITGVHDGCETRGPVTIRSATCVNRYDCLCSRLCRQLKGREWQVSAAV